MKADSEQTKAKLTDEKARLNKEFEEMKYSGEAKTSSYEKASFFFVCHYLFLLLVVNVFSMKLKRNLMKATNVLRRVQ
jgi:hypothetical protein